MRCFLKFLREAHNKSRASSLKFRGSFLQSEYQYWRISKVLLSGDFYTLYNVLLLFLRQCLLAPWQNCLNSFKAYPVLGHESLFPFYFLAVVMGNFTQFRINEALQAAVTNKLGDKLYVKHVIKRASTSGKTFLFFFFEVLQVQSCTWMPRSLLAKVQVLRHRVGGREGKGDICCAWDRKDQIAVQIINKKEFCFRISSVFTPVKT